jgi:hypothetical protein
MVRDMADWDANTYHVVSDPQYARGLGVPHVPAQ